MNKNYQNFLTENSKICCETCKKNVKLELRKLQVLFNKCYKIMKYLKFTRKLKIIRKWIDVLISPIPIKCKNFKKFKPFLKELLHKIN